MFVIGVTGAVTIATIENIQYLIKTFYAVSPCCTSPLELFIEVLMRNIFSVTLHISTGAFIGTKISQIYIYDSSILLSIPKILIIPIFLHGIFDSSLLWTTIEIKQTDQYWFSAVNIVAFIAVVLALILAFVQVKIIELFVVYYLTII